MSSIDKYPRLKNDLQGIEGWKPLIQMDVEYNCSAFISHILDHENMVFDDMSSDRIYAYFLKTVFDLFDSGNIENMVCFKSISHELSTYLRKKDNDSKIFSGAFGVYGRLYFNEYGDIPEWFSKNKKYSYPDGLNYEFDPDMPNGGVNFIDFSGQTLFRYPILDEVWNYKIIESARFWPSINFFNTMMNPISMPDGQASKSLYWARLGNITLDILQIKDWFCLYSRSDNPFFDKNERLFDCFYQYLDHFKESAKVENLGIIYLLSEFNGLKTIDDYYIQVKSAQPESSRFESFRNKVEECKHLVSTLMTPEDKKIINSLLLTHQLNSYDDFRSAMCLYKEHIQLKLECDYAKEEIVF